jgi:hypothetical protein
MNSYVSKITLSIIVFILSVIISVFFSPLGVLVDELFIGTCKTGLFLVAFNFFE